MKKRIFLIVVALALALTVLFVLPAPAEAATAQETGNAILENVLKQDGTFPETLPTGQTTYSAKCYACGGATKEWKPLTKSFGTAFEDGGHYYLPKNVTINGQVFQFQTKTACLHTNGKTWTDESYRVALVNAGSTFNIMGGGAIYADTKNNRGVLYCNGAGTINVYGTTIKNTATTVSDYGNACVTMYNTDGVANFWGCRLEGSSVSPSIITNGAVNLYNCEVTGPAPQIGGYSGRPDSKAALNLYDSTVTGVDVKTGAVTVSGAVKITGTGLNLPAGKTINPSKLTAGASIAIANDGAFTGTGMAGYAKYFTAVNNDRMILANAQGALCCVPKGAVLVANDGSITAADDALAQWQSGDYAYIKLYGNATFADLGGVEVYIDINGNDLTVGGSGTLHAFDSANDAFDADACGTITNNGTVFISADVQAPNGNRYFAITDGATTMHRLDARINTVTLRTTAAGLYYKAVYYCDSILSAKVKNYGVVLSVDNMPGDDFLTETDDINRYTVATADFESGVIATSGSVFGIMKPEREAAVNHQYGEVDIYANAYVQFEMDNLIAVGDAENAGKTTADAGFTGSAWSLHKVLDALDDSYYSCTPSVQNQLDNFYYDWDEDGMQAWKFVNIGDGVDNSDLVFDEGTTNAFCPVCKEKVTWTELTAKDTHQNLKGHYYLDEDQTVTHSGDAFFFNSTKNTTLCVHLNGHNLTATKTRVVHGSSGRTNIMGNGIVTGYHGTADYGAAVMVNNAVANQSVHLYGGTYKKTANSKDGAAPLCVSSVGGAIAVYKGVTVDGGDGPAVIVRNPNANAVKQELRLYGCTVNGDVKLMGGAPSVSAVTASVELLDCTINGNVDIAKLNHVSLIGAPVIEAITRHEDIYLDPTALIGGASIGIAEDGIFSIKVENAAAYTGYFHGTGASDTITVRDGALHCGPDFAGNLRFAEGTNDAMCPVCAKTVTWIPVDGSAVINNTGANHYYLTKNVTFTATGGELSFLSPGHGDYSVCFHLNGHDFTGTNTRFIYGGTSIVNVMGSGTVSCARGDNYRIGSTIQTNTNNIRGTINLYGGIWTQEETGAHTAEDYVISMSDNGGTINVHEGATVQANSNGNAIYLGTSNMRDTIAGISGTVKGDVYVAGANQAQGFVSYVTVDNGTIEGTLDINGVNTVTVSHAAKIQLLDMEKTSLVTLDTLKPGALITVLNEGVFTEPNNNAEAYVGYFRAANTHDSIQVQEGALRYKINYTAKLEPDANGKDYCPVCKDTVQWIAISSSESAVKAEAGKHYYLTTDILFEAEYDSTNGPVAFLSGGSFKNASACFHLNSHNITATKTHGIFGGYGVLNVMGDGIVTGYARGVSSGGAVQINNSVAGNCLKLYSGTYRNAANSKAGSSVAAIWQQGSGLTVYEDADISNAGGLAVYVNYSKSRHSNLEIYGATINGNVEIAAPIGETCKAKVIFDNATINGQMTIAAGNEITMNGRTKISKLNIAAGQLVTFANMLEGSNIAVSADGIFSGVMPQADEWLKYITCADEGDWIIVRDKQFYQGVKTEISAATQSDRTALDTTYAGKTVRYGEMHNHTNSGPLRDDGTGYSPSTGADGKNSLEEWIAEMDRLDMDFAFIVDHGMSIHMYKEKFLPDYFVGGTEPGTTITDSKAANAKPHYNMLFADPAKLESIFFKWQEKYQPMRWNLETRPNALNPSEDGYRVKYPQFTTAEFAQLAKDVYAAGGLLVQVHPKYDSYIYSDDPMDYYFADYTGFEITTGNGRNMMYKDNNEAYDCWVDMLEMGKKVWATAGSDGHKLPDYSALTAIYTVNDHRDDYMAAVRAGNIAPGWIGIRMNVNGTEMGGETAFAGNRLQFSVGDIYIADQVDSIKTPAPYVEGHTYRVELYDDGGILMSSRIDPTELSYFAIDCDSSAKFYRIVVWDETDNERIGVSNPIWNTAVQ